MAAPKSHTANTLVVGQLDGHLGALESQLDADVLTFVGRIISGSDNLIRDAIEAISQRKSKLCVILETPGGYIEVAERVANTFHRHYERVEFIIPNYAMSAGTVLVMSGNAIYMDYFSILGPIDPQVERPDGPQLIPALGYLIQYERLLEKSRRGELTTAELAFLVQKFDPAELYQYEQAREHSITLLKEWLVKYKFRDWRKTETRGKRVTQAMRTARAAQIAKTLNDTKRWHSHGRGISMEVLRKDLKLKIDDFGANTEVNEKIRTYYGLLKDYMARVRHQAILHTNGRYLVLWEG